MPLKRAEEGARNLRQFYNSSYLVTSVVEYVTPVLRWRLSASSCEQSSLGIRNLPSSYTSLVKLGSYSNLLSSSTSIVKLCSCRTNAF